MKRLQEILVLITNFTQNIVRITGSEILSGSLDESVVESLCTLAAHAPTDERLTVAGLLLDGWNTLFLKFREEDQFAVALQKRTPSGQSLTS